MTPRDDATERQVRAARPDVSTWLAANAGSGKTRVLTDRVARLLLDEIPPEHILCLTYTKAAASEMQNRLFKRLGEWAMKPDADLRAELTELGASGPFDADRLAKARTLFASAIETPGGLKIQTIHSFCSSLLRRFPLEAGVSPQFQEMEERATELLRMDILEDMASGPDAHLVSAIAAQYTAEDFEKLTAQIVGHRTAFAAETAPAEIYAYFDVDPALTLDRLLADLYTGTERDLLEVVIKAMEQGSPTDIANATTLRQITDLNADALPILEKVFLFGENAKAPFGAKIGSVPTKKGGQKFLSPDTLDDLNDLMERVQDTRTKRVSLLAAEKTVTLHRFARAFLPRYDHAKLIRGWLDFDDLITRARDLLSDPAVAQWVLYRIDGGIDHILVDEAQDTSPVQWEVIRLLAQEFTSGQGARDDVLRTIFVVGDKKQSIYSFQGADPREFDRMCDEFGGRITAMGNAFAREELEFSFRSSHAILSLVDQTFDGQAEAGFDGAKHRAFKSDMPGRVDLWPLIEKAEKEDDGDWFEPVDRPSPQNPTVQLAHRIADEIKRMIDSKTPIPDEIENTGQYKLRPVHAGDFLILVQRRSALFHEINRACKERGLPIAGADRLKVGAELAVRDLAALLSVLALPEDDLSLATVLRSPLGGWSEQQLFTLAHGRGKKYLWQLLRDQTSLPVVAMLLDLRQKADFLRPYDLLERILTRHDGHRKLLARLGPEAEDGINALLQQALAFERSNIPSLTGFLVWLETDDVDIKRQMDAAGDRIRVMTVHGAKGLEAPIVILPDTAQRRARQTANILTAKPEHIPGENRPAESVPLWSVASDERPQTITDLIAEMGQNDEYERERLLYVAMTRAEKWLIVAASGDLGKDGKAWYDRVGTAMQDQNAPNFDFPFGTGLRIEHGDWSGPVEEIADRSVSNKAELDPVFTQSVPEPLPAKDTLKPSDLGGAKALPGEAGQDEEAAKRRGRMIHLLLEHLPNHPRDAWENIAWQVLDDGEDPPEDHEIAPLLSEAANVLTHPELAPVFSTDALAEVAMTANIPGLNGERIHGIVDRLIIEPDRILIVDFKTNAVVPDTPEKTPNGLLRQMGAYAQAAAQLYPDRKIDTAILWTSAAKLMVLPHDLVTAALQDTTTP